LCDDTPVELIVGLIGVIVWSTIYFNFGFFISFAITHNESSSVWGGILALGFMLSKFAHSMIGAYNNHGYWSVLDNV